MKAKARYEPLCDAADGQRFRVRAEILDNSEDYITVQMGCYLEGVVNLPWAEYSSADLEIRYGSQLDLARKIRTMVRRSLERLGFELDARTAMQYRGTAEETQLLMSNKEWKSLLERQPAKPVRSTRPNPPGPMAPVPAPKAPVGYYDQQSADASRLMEEQFRKLFPGDNPIVPWGDSESVTDSIPQASAQVPPPSQQRGTRTPTDAAHGRSSSSAAGGGAYHAPPPSDPGMTPRVPAPKGPGPVNIPAPTTSGGR